MAFFSSDIISEILSRSSLTTVGKCRLLSKECNNLTYESNFMNLHCQRTKTASGFFLQSMKNNKYSSTFVSIDNSCSNSNLSLDFLPVPVKIEASTGQGLLLCVDQRTRIPRYYVCKPSTKEWQVIPNPKTRFFTQKIAMVVLKSNPLHYKIVRFSEFKSSFDKFEYYSLRCEIFDSISNAWKELKEVTLPYDEFLRYTPSVSACGSLHWLTKNNVLAFNHEDKENHYSLFSLPSPVYENNFYDCCQLTEYEGKLGLICMKARSVMDLWVMGSYSKKLWSKRHTISLESLKEEEPYPNPVGFYNADIALVNGFYTVIFFKFKNNGSTSITNDDIVRLEKQTSGVFPFKSDLEPANLKTKFGQQRGSRTKERRNKSQSLCQNLGFFNISPSFVFLLLLFAFIFFCFIFDI